MKYVIFRFFGKSLISLYKYYNKLIFNSYYIIKFAFFLFLKMKHYYTKNNTFVIPLNRQSTA